MRQRRVGAVGTSLWLSNRRQSLSRSLFSDLNKPYAAAGSELDVRSGVHFRVTPAAGVSRLSTERTPIATADAPASTQTPAAKIESATSQPRGHEERFHHDVGHCRDDRVPGASEAQYPLFSSKRCDHADEHIAKSLGRLESVVNKFNDALSGQRPRLVIIGQAR